MGAIDLKPHPVMDCGFFLLWVLRDMLHQRVKQVSFADGVPLHSSAVLARVDFKNMRGSHTFDS